MRRLGEALGRLVVAAPRRVILVATLLSLVLASGATRLRLSADYRMFFAPDDPRLAALDSLEETFGKSDDVVIVLAPRSSLGDVFEDGVLAAVREAADGAAALPHAVRVDALTTHIDARSTDGALDIVPLVAEDADPAALAALRTRALAEPLLVGSLVAADGRATGVVATLDLPRDDPAAVTETAAAARALVGEVRAAHPELEVRLSGLAMMNDALMESSVADISWSVPLMALVIAVGMALLLRSAAATAGILGVVALSSAAALGAAGWLGYPLTPISASAPTIIVTLCLADGVHLVLGVRQARAAGRGAHEAIRASLRENLQPVVLTSVSTMVGFLALNFAKSPPFAHMANTTAVGVGVALVLSVTLLPAVLALAPGREDPGRAGSAGAASVLGSSAWDAFASAITARPSAWLAGGLLLGALGLAAATTLDDDDRFVAYFAPTVPFRADTEFMVEHLAGIYVVEVAVPAGAPGAVAEPAHLQQLDRFAAWLRARPEVSHVSSVSDLVKRLNEGLGRGYAVPDRRELAAQELLAYEMALPAGLTLADRIDPDRSATRVTAVVRDVPSSAIADLAADMERWWAAEGVAVHAVSPPVLFSHLSRENTLAMVRGNLASLLLISLGMVAALRSWRIGLLSMVPNLLPIALAYGVWALFVGTIGIVASVAVAVCLGIIVDDTIHFLSRYVALRREGLAPEDAVRRTLRAVGTALVLTSVLLVCGFGVLTLSTFAVNRVFGQLVILVVGLGLAADLVVLPAALLVVDRPRAAYPWKVQMLARHVAVALLALLPTLAAAEPAPPDAAAVKQRLQALGEGYGDMTASVRMTLRAANGKEAVRDLHLVLLEREEADWSLIAFDSPADVRGTALLSHPSAQGADQQWLYLPALDQTRRIGGTGRSGAFVGTEFSFEDVTDLELAKHDWTVLGAEDCAAGRCWALQTAPRSGSAYARRVVLVDQERFLPQQITFWDARGELLKTLTYSDYEHVDGKFWRARTWTMENAQTGRATVLAFDGMAFGTGKTDADLAPDALKRAL
ncbi:MAG: outer membrane lipoprotein-sorting protein [Myxococcota bacterium]